MEDKIIELISLLSVEYDSELIECLYSKLFEIHIEKDKQKDFSYKYSLSKFSNTREMSTLYMGLKKAVKYSYKSKELNRILKIEDYIYNNLCCPCVQVDCEKCMFKKRIQFSTKMLEKHDGIKAKIIEDLDSDFILNKLLINKIIVKLNNFKNKTK